MWYVMRKCVTVFTFGPQCYWSVHYCQPFSSIAFCINDGTCHLYKINVLWLRLNEFFFSITRCLILLMLPMFTTLNLYVIHDYVPVPFLYGFIFPSLNRIRWSDIGIGIAIAIAINWKKQMKQNKTDRISYFHNKSLIRNNSFCPSDPLTSCTHTINCIKFFFSFCSCIWWPFLKKIKYKIYKWRDHGK